MLAASDSIGRHPVKVLIYGATGMVGRGVLLECRRDSDVTHGGTICTQNATPPWPPG